MIFKGAAAARAQDMASEFRSKANIADEMVAGKEIQVVEGGEWRDVTYPDSLYGHRSINFRIKPEPPKPQAHMGYNEQTFPNPFPGAEEYIQVLPPT